MTTAATTVNEPVELQSRGYLAKPPGWWGMALFILTEAILFSLLLASYFYLLSSSAVWPPAGTSKPDLLLPGIDTAILLGSSIPMFWATYAIGHGQRRNLSIALALSGILAIIFLAIQAYSLMDSGISATENAYGSIFLTVELTHAAHLVVALLLLSYALVRNQAGHFTQEHHLGVETTAMYWHFVDVVWIFVFLSLHIAPYVFAP
jgi:heme/copper-type cytochrome/quinol oxidase subunit 3